MRLARGTWLIVVLIAVLAGAPAANAGTLSKVNGEYVYTEAEADLGQNTVVLYYCAATECSASEPGPYFLIRDVDDSISESLADCAPSTTSPTYLKCTDVSVTSWHLVLGGGNDTVLPQQTPTPFSVPVRVDAGPGTDSVNGTGHADSLSGGAGEDVLTGIGGDDVLDGGLDSDVLNGGADTDTTTYPGRSLGVRVDLEVAGPDDGSSEDGAAGSRDTTNDIENATGGAGPDELRGTSGANVLDGGAGDDTLNAFAGQDTLLGGSGIDNVQARDGEADSVDCGPDEDAATTDGTDTRVNCDAVPPAQAQPQTIVITQPAPPARVLLDLAYSFTAGRTSTTLRNLVAEGEPGARVTVTCRTRKNKRCTRTRDLARTAASVRLKGFEGKRLPVGAKLTVRVTKDGMIGAVKTLTIRKRKAPSLKTLCLPPGASSPSPC
jgi:hypothetical protein